MWRKMDLFSNILVGLVKSGTTRSVSINVPVIINCTKVEECFRLTKKRDSSTTAQRFFALGCSCIDVSSTVITKIINGFKCNISLKSVFLLIYKHIVFFECLLQIWHDSSSTLLRNTNLLRPSSTGACSHLCSIKSYNLATCNSS